MRTRRSTSGGVAFLGSHCIKTWSSTQSIVALSSAEAELTGLSKGGQNGLGLKSLCKDLGLDLRLRLHTDSTAAIGVCRRRGIGRIRHLAVADLWLQDKIRTGDMSIHKVLGADNPADIMTKYVNQAVLEKGLQRMQVVTEEGRAESAAQIASMIPACLETFHRKVNGTRWRM